MLFICREKTAMKLPTIVLLATFSICYGKSENEFPDIEDLFPTMETGEVNPLKDVKIDLDNIDLEKFKKKLDLFETQVFQNDSMAVYAQDARRQQIPYLSRWQWNHAAKHNLRVKAIDMMLQTIYMARHQVRQLENESHYNTKDTAYRVAFLYRKLRRTWRRIMDIYSQIKKRYRRTRVDRAMIMHTKALKLYEDFMYLWWVLIKVDGKYHTRLRTTRQRKTTTKLPSTNDYDDEREPPPFGPSPRPIPDAGATGPGGDPAGGPDAGSDPPNQASAEPSGQDVATVP